MRLRQGVLIPIEDDSAPAAPATEPDQDESASQTLEEARALLAAAQFSKMLKERRNGQRR